VIDGTSTGENRLHGQAAVVKLQLTAEASGVPSAAFAPTVTVAVYDAFAARVADGVSVAVREALS